MFGFGHRAESSWDGVMRLAFCVDGDEDTHAGVEVRQYGDELELVVHGHEDRDRVSQQVARVLSCDHDGDASGPSPGASCPTRTCRHASASAADPSKAADRLLPAVHRHRPCTDG